MVKFNLKNVKRSIISISILLILSLTILYKLILAPWLNKHYSSHQGIMSVLVTAQKPMLQDIIDAVEAVGTIKADESVILRPEIAGRITSFNFEEGQAVQAGAVLITLDDEISKAQLAQAEANLGLSKINMWRAEALQKKNVGTVIARDEAATKLKIDESQYALEKARLEKSRLTAPFDGIIGLRKVSPGDYVQVGQELVNIEKMNPIKVDFTLPEIYLVQLKAGQEVELTAPAHPNLKFQGQIYAIDPHINENGRNVLARARLENPDFLLKPGMFVKVKVNFAVRKNSLVIPETTLIPGPTQTSVYKIVDQKAQLATVKIGQRQEGSAEILEGIKADDLIITAGHLKLRPGAPVTIKPKAGASS